jgi:ribonuclease BN (tRNA processing enzyme)
VSPHLKLTVLGSGDPFGSGGRNQSGYLIQAGAARWLLDCGVTTLVSLKRLGVDPASLDLVLLTHLHGDHVAGLPLLFHEFQHLSGRATPLTVAGPRGVKTRVEAIYKVLFPAKPGNGRRFRVNYEVLEGNRRFFPAGPGGPQVVPFPVRHQASRMNFGYRISWRGRELAYSGDTGWFPALAEQVRGAHLFLCECTHASKQSGKHLSLSELRANRKGLEVGTLLLTHLGPELARRRHIPGFKLARDGMTIRV